MRRLVTKNRGSKSRKSKRHDLAKSSVSTTRRGTDKEKL